MLFYLVVVEAIVAAQLYFVSLLVIPPYRFLCLERFVAEVAVTSLHLYYYMFRNL